MMTRPSTSAAAAAAPGTGGILRWFENFNAPPLEPEPEPPPPEATFTESDLSVARAEAWNDGYITASRAAERAAARQDTQVFAALLAQAEALDRRLDHLVEQNARIVARWLAGAFAAALPGLAPAAMEGRMQAAADLLRPALRGVSRIEVACGGQDIACCATLDDAWQAAERWRTEHPATTDITIAWSGADARIDLQRSWEQIKAALLPVGQGSAGTGEILFSLTQPTGADHVG